MKNLDPQNIEQNFDELELVAEKAGELNDRVGKIESELGAQTKTLESAALVLDAAIKGLGALKSSVLENDIGALQLALNDKTAHLAREIARFETAVAEIDRRAEAGDEQLAASLRDTALGLRESFNAKNAELSEWSARVEREIAAHSVALAAIPPVIKGADAKPFNPRGEWQAGMIVNSLDVVSYNGSSYISNEDGNTEKPTRSAKYTTLAKRSGNGAGGATDFAGITGSITPAQIVPGQATFAVGDVLYAGTTGTLSKLGAGTSGQLLSTQGAGAAPIWVTATGGAGDMNGPGSATDNAIVRFDGTGGKTVQNSAVTVADTTGAMTWSGDATLSGGSSGASLVLGQGTSGSATLASKGTGFVGADLASDTALLVKKTANGSGLFLAGPSASGSVITGGAYYNGANWTAGAGSSAMSGILFSNFASGDISFVNKTGLTPGASYASNDTIALFTATKNLLIGTTTDIAAYKLNVYGPTSANVIAANGVTPDGTKIGGIFATALGGTGSASGSYALAGDVAGRVVYNAYGNNFIYEAGAIQSTITTGGNTDRNLHVAALDFLTKPTGSNTPVTVARLTGTGNLLIGTTTDMSGVTGGLHVAGTTAASSSTLGGALRVGGNVAISGNAGGASYFGGTLNVGDGSVSVPAYSFGADTNSGWYRGGGDAVRLALGGVETLNMDLGASIATAVMQWKSTLSASTSLAGAFRVGDGITAATNVAIGGGNINAGGTITTGGAATFAGAVTIAGTVIHTLSATPASASAAGTVGTMSWDANYIYICTATNTWKRVAIATW